MPCCNSRSTVDCSAETRHQPEDRSVRRSCWATVASFILLLTVTAVSAQSLPAPSRDLSLSSATPRAAAGDVTEELRLAGNYLIGKGVPKDPVQSAYWYRKAADHGNPEAQNETGYFYVTGFGVQKNEIEAGKWFARAAGCGSQAAKLNLAVMYLKGIGVRKDIPFGVDLLTQLASKGNARAEDYLGAIYFSGYGVPADPGLAEHWFSRSARGKNPEGEYAMGTLYSTAPGHEHNYAKAADFLRKSAHAGFVPSMSALGILLIHHPEIRQKRSDEALLMLNQAAEAGMWESSVTLGILSRDGQGTSRDLAEAYRWFVIATRQGGNAAEQSTFTDLVHCRQMLSEHEQDQKMQEAEEWLQRHPNSSLYVLSNGLTVPWL